MTKWRLSGEAFLIFPRNVSARMILPIMLSEPYKPSKNPS